MELATWRHAIERSADLWGAVAGGAIWAVAATLAGRRGDAPWAAGAGFGIWIGAAAGVLAGDGSIAIPAVLAVAHVIGLWLLPHRALRPRASQPLVSAVAVAALYACLPDTEGALALGGAVWVAAAWSLALRVRWYEASWVVTAGITVVTLVDGTARDGALVAGLVIALLHAVVVALPIGPAGLLIAGAGMVAVARTAGLREELGDAVAVAVAVAFAALCAIGVAELTSARYGTEHVDPAVRRR